MPRVPVAENLVERQPLTNAKLVVPDNGGGVAGGISRGLEALGRAGTQLVSAQEQVFEQVDQAAVKQGFTRYSAFRDKRLHTDDDAYYRQSGQNALNARSATERQLKVEYDSILNGLNTPRQKRMFEEHVGQERARDLVGIGDYAARQGKVYDDQASAGLQYQMSNTAVTAALAGDEEGFAVALGTMRKSMRSQAEANGLQGEPARAAEFKAVSDVYGSIVAQKAVKDTQDAKRYLDLHRGEIDADTQRRLDQQLEPYLQDERIDTLANAVRGTGPVTEQLSPHAPTTSNVAAKLIQLESGGNPSARNRMPGQTASGLGQFTDATWLSLYKKTYGAGGRSDPEILALKTDPMIGRQMVDAGVRDVRKSLGHMGLPTDDGAVRLAWFLGPDKAGRVMRASPETPVASLVPADYVTNNAALLKGKTAGQVIDRAYREMGGTGHIGAPVNARRRNDLASQLAAVDGMDLPYKQAQALKQRLMQLDSIDERLKADDERAAADQAWTYALDPKNTTIRSIPSSVWARVSPEQQRSIMGALAHNGADKDPQPNPDLYLDLSEKAANGTLTFSDVRAAWGKLPKGDWEQMATLARTVEKKDQPSSKAAKVTLATVKGVVDAAVDATPGLSFAGIGNKAADAPARQRVSQRRYAFEKAIMDDISAWQAQPENKGKAPDAKAIQGMADRLLIQWNRGEKQPKGWFGETDADPVYRFEVRPGTRGHWQIPTADYQRLRGVAVRILGREPTQDEVGQAYLAEARGGR